MSDPIILLEDVVDWYSLVLFLHLVGALALFVGIGLEQVGLRGLRRARTTGALREWLGVMRERRRVEGPAGLVLLLSGGYMMHTNWGGHPWIGVGVLGLVLMALLGILVTGRTVRSLLAALPADDRPIPTTLSARFNGWALRGSSVLRAAIALGVVFDMTVKPDGPGAVIVLLAALIIGALVALVGAPQAPAEHELGAEH